MVLYYDNVDNWIDNKAAAWCKERGWKYHEDIKIYSCEAQCVVLLNCGLRTEFLTRARNMLIIVNHGNTEDLQIAVDHSGKRYQCKEMSDCPYIGTTVIE